VADSPERRLDQGIGLGIAGMSLLRKFAGLLGAAVLVLLAGLPAVPAGAATGPAEGVIDGSVQDCLRCHRMETLAYQDRVTGRLVDLHVPPADFQASNHGERRCLDCHEDEGFKAFPHSEKAKEKSLHCLNCHDDPENPKFKNYRFKEIALQFEKSIHFEKHGKKFTCFSCHDPHAFEVAKNKETTAAVIAQDNGMCLNCHAEPARFTSLTERRFPDLETSHAWLPNTERHWARARCVECHTPHGERISHQILGAKKAERNCVECHSRDSILLTQLYKHRASESREKLGFVNAAVLNDAYIIGATRNRFLDWLGFGLVGFVSAGVFGHGLGRLLSGRRRKGGGRHD
jgi:hypothetical protein